MLSETVLKNDNDLYAKSNNGRKETKATGSPATTQLIPPKVQHTMFRTYKHKQIEPVVRHESLTRNNKTNNSTCCSLSVTCRLVNNLNKQSPVDNNHQQHANVKKTNEALLEQVRTTGCCSNLSTYSKVKLKSSPLRTNHRKNIKSKSSQIHDFIRNMLTANKRITSSVTCIKTKFSTSPTSTTTRQMKSSSSSASSSSSVSRTKFTLLPSLGTTSFITLLTIICLETVLLSTMSTCAKTFYMHWNTSNSIFRIDNTDHIIDVNKGNLAFEFDQVHIICPVYEPGTFENETEKYIIYNVSKVEYETCRITNADPRVIAICDKPHKLMFFTITFRPFTPQPGGLEFLPGNDYYFISTSSKDDLYRRIGGRCSTNNMKVVFKVCCAQEEKNRTISGGGNGKISGGGGGDSIGNTVTSSSEVINIDMNTQTNGNKQMVTNIHGNGINTINTGLIPNSGININSATNNGIHLNPLNGGGGASINTNVDQFNRIPIQTNGINVIGNGMNNGAGLGNHGGIMLTPGHSDINMIPPGSIGGVGIGQFPGLHGQTGIRINNVPPQQHYPTHKSNNDDLHHYDKHPNEVVKNEELTYNSGGYSIHDRFNCRIPFVVMASPTLSAYVSSIRAVVSELIYTFNSKQYYYKETNNFINLSFNPLILVSILLVIVAQCSYNYSLSVISDTNSYYLRDNRRSRSSVTSTQLPSQSNNNRAIRRSDDDQR